MSRREGPTVRGLSGWATWRPEWIARYGLAFVLCAVLAMRAQLSHHRDAGVGEATRIVSILRLGLGSGIRCLSLAGSAPGSNGPEVVRLVLLR